MASLRLSRTDLTLANISALACFALFLPFASFGVDAHHDGIMLKPALDVLDGQTLHRDTFTQYGPLTTLIHSAVMRVFGERLLVLRVATLAVESLAIGLLTLAWRPLMPWRVILAIVVFWCCLPYFYTVTWPLLPWSSSTAMFFQAACVLAMSVATRPSTRSSRVVAIAFAGVCASATFWCRQPVGGLLAIAGASIPIAMGIREGSNQGMKLDTVWRLTIGNRYFRAYTLGGIGFALLMLGWLVGSHAFGDWFEQNIAYPRTFASNVSTWRSTIACFVTLNAAMPAIALISIALAIRALWRCVVSTIVKAAGCCGVGAIWLAAATVYPNVTSLDAVQKMIPLALCGMVGFLLYRQRSLVLGAAVAQGALLPAMASWAQYYPVNCIRHMYWSLGPIVGVFVFLLGKTFALRPAQLAATVILFALPIAATRIQDAREHVAAVGEPLVGPDMLCGMRPYRVMEKTRNWHYGYDADLAVFGKLSHDIHEQFPETPLMLMGPDALLALAAKNRLNPGPYYVAWTPLKQFGAFTDRDRFLIERYPLIVLQTAYGRRPRVPPKASELGYVPEFRGRAFSSDVYLLRPSSVGRHRRIGNQNGGNDTSPASETSTIESASRN